MHIAWKTWCSRYNWKAGQWYTVSNKHYSGHFYSTVHNRDVPVHAGDMLEYKGCKMIKLPSEKDADNRPLFVRLFEIDGVSVWTQGRFAQDYLEPNDPGVKVNFP